MMYNKTMKKKQKIIAIIIYSLIALFFFAEMLMKPISGEDAYQSECVSKAETVGAYAACVRSSLNYIPRLGQTIHIMIISSFTTMPSLGINTLFRLIDALMSIGIIYMIVLLAHGRGPKLNYHDAITAALATTALLLSDFTQMFFFGFSNVHNYVPAVFFALVFFYQWFYGDNILKNSKHRGAHLAIFAICAFCFSASLELNPFIAFLMIVSGAIIALIRKIKSRKINSYLREHIPALIGIVLGFVMQYVIGRGFAATVGRSGNYHSSSKISGLWVDPIHAIPHFFNNTVLNYSNYLPYLFIAIIALVILYRQNRRDTRIKLFTAIITYAIIYIAGCFAFDSIMWRITASVFCLLLVPGTFLISEIIMQLDRKWNLVCAILIVFLLASMNIDNISFHIKANSTIRDTLDNTADLGCLSPTYIKERNIPAKSLLYGFDHTESTFTYVESTWYDKEYLVDGHIHYPINDGCHLTNGNLEQEIE